MPFQTCIHSWGVVSKVVTGLACHRGAAFLRVAVVKVLAKVAISLIGCLDSNHQQVANTRCPKKVHISLAQKVEL